MNLQSRKPTNLSLDSHLLLEARGLKINLSRAAEEGLKRAVATAKAQQWKTENAAALKSSNSYVDANGLPLDTFRQF